MKELNENELAKKFDALHSKFVANQVNKIQRYLTNNLGLEPVNGKKPLNKFKVREFVTQRFVDGKVQYAIKLSYGSKTVAIVPTGSIEADEDSIVKSLTAVYHELLNNEYEETSGIYLQITLIWLEQCCLAEKRVQKHH